MNLQQAQYLLSIEQCGNISKAAEACFVSQPALTKQMQLLEQEFHAPLFQREKGKMVPTEVGNVVINSARSMLFARQWMRQAMEELRAKQENQQKILCQKAYCDSVRFLVHALRQTRFLDLNMQVISGNEEAAWPALQAGTVDLAIFNTHQLPENAFPYHILHVNEMFLAISNTHPAVERLQRGEKWTEVLREETFFLHREGAPARVYENAYLSNLGFMPRNVRIIENEGDSIGALSHSGCAGFLPYQLGDSLLFRMPLTPPFHFYTVIAWPKGEMDEKVAALKDLLMLEYH